MQSYTALGAVAFGLFTVEAAASMVAGNDPDLLHVTSNPLGCDSLPMFSADATQLLFASSGGGSEPGEINVFLAKWNDLATEANR